MLQSNIIENTLNMYTSIQAYQRTLQVFFLSADERWIVYLFYGW